MAGIICTILVSLTLVIIIMWLRSIVREQSRIYTEFEELRAQYDLMRRELVDYIEDMEIVRCRDCRHFKKGEEEPPVDWCDYFHDEVTPSGFCAWGEKVVSE